jgi:hypothetical protein
VAVATHAEGFTTLAGIIPGFIFHAASFFAGIIFFGLGMRTGAKNLDGKAIAEALK